MLMVHNLNNLKHCCINEYMKTNPYVGTATGFGLVVLFLTLSTFREVQGKEKYLAVEGNLFSIHHAVLPLVSVGIKD
jgi:hypothetical protein